MRAYNESATVAAAYPAGYPAGGRSIHTNTRRVNGDSEYRSAGCCAHPSGEPCRDSSTEAYHQRRADREEQTGEDREARGDRWFDRIQIALVFCSIVGSIVCSYFIPF